MTTPPVGRIAGGGASGSPSCASGVARSAQDWADLLIGPAELAAAALEQAAQEGLPLAQLHYGQVLLDGRGVAADARVALGWFYRAAQADVPMAMNMVGRCFDQGWGVAEDPAQAVPWFRAAASRGLDWGLYNLATLLALGRGVAEDKAEALTLFRRAAAKGHAKSSNMVGSFHEDGWVVPRNMKLAAYHFARAAEGGDFRGAFNHARMLIGQGTVDRALPWLERAAVDCPPRFLAQMADWLLGQDHDALRDLARRLTARGQA